MRELIFPLLLDELLTVWSKIRKVILVSSLKELSPIKMEMTI